MAPPPPGIDANQSDSPTSTLRTSSPLSADRMIGNGLVMRLKNGKYRIDGLHPELMAVREEAGAGRIVV